MPLELPIFIIRVFIITMELLFGTQARGFWRRYHLISSSNGCAVLSHYRFSIASIGQVAGTSINSADDDGGGTGEPFSFLRYSRGCFVVPT